MFRRNGRCLRTLKARLDCHRNEEAALENESGY